MNTIESLHPILVHFPVALLTMYAILECVRFRKITSWPSYFFIKAFLVIAGFLAAIAAYSAGPDGTEIHGWAGYAGMTGSNGRPILNQIVNMHSNFATITLIIFGIIAVAYLIVWIQSFYKINHKIWNALMSVAVVIQNPFVGVILALIGLVAVTITGALGGSIVFGPNVDPVVSFFYHLFF